MSHTDTLRKLFALSEQFRNCSPLRVAKNRQGRTGGVRLFCHGEFTCLDAWAGAVPTKQFSGVRHDDH